MTAYQGPNVSVGWSGPYQSVSPYPHHFVPRAFPSWQNAGPSVPTETNKYPFEPAYRGTVDGLGWHNSTPDAFLSSNLGAVASLECKAIRGSMAVVAGLAAAKNAFEIGVAYWAYTSDKKSPSLWKKMAMGYLGVDGALGMLGAAIMAGTAAMLTPDKCQSYIDNVKNADPTKYQQLIKNIKAA